MGKTLLEGDPKMIDRKLIEANLEHTLQNSQITGIGEKLKGKVRDIYVDGETIHLVATDRQSAFDRNLAWVPFKGQVLTETSSWWFEQVSDIIPNHVIAHPDPNVVTGKKLTIFPVEFVMRGYLTGSTSTSAWTAYERGEYEFCGNILPRGMKKNQAFDKPIITPTTKDDDHDEKITPHEIISSGRMTQEQWEYTSQKAFEIFQRGQEIAAKHGLILVDTKYEFGYDEDGTIYLCDEIHTPDSSRYWIADSYQDRFERGENPDNIDKEFLRLWFKERCDPYKDEVLPEAPTELIVELSSRYIQLYEMITGKEFVYYTGDVEERIQNNMNTYKEGVR